MTLREEFCNKLKLESTSSIEFLLKDNNSSYIKFLEDKIEDMVKFNKCDCGCKGA